MKSTMNPTQSGITSSLLQEQQQTMSRQLQNGTLQSSLSSQQRNRMITPISLSRKRPPGTLMERRQIVMLLDEALAIGREMDIELKSSTIVKQSRRT